MKFSGNGLYIEEYLKCANCGYLIYEADLDKSIKVGSKLFCSEWCNDWHDEREKKEKNEKQ